MDPEKIGARPLRPQYESIISAIPGAKVIDNGQEFLPLYAKAEHFGLPPERIMKTVYFEDGEIVVAAVLPITERVDTGALAAEAGAKKLRLARESSLPKGQYPGSLGPWIAGEDDWERVSKVLFIEGDYGITDWAYPGDPGRSVHADYCQVFNALSGARPDKYAFAEISMPLSA